MTLARSEAWDYALKEVPLPGITTLLERGAEGDVGLCATGAELLPIREWERQTKAHSRLNVELQPGVEIQFSAS